MKDLEGKMETTHMYISKGSSSPHGIQTKRDRGDDSNIPEGCQREAVSF